jgi:hypothetical protein
VKAAVNGGAQTLLPLLVSLAETARPPSSPDLPAPKPPALILSIDQGEELFLAEGTEEAEKFLALLKDLLTAATPNVIALVTIRSDSYERLQLAKPLEGVDPGMMNLLARGRRRHHWRRTFLARRQHALWRRQGKRFGPGRCPLRDGRHDRDPTHGATLHLTTPPHIKHLVEGGHHV